MSRGDDPEQAADHGLPLLLLTAQQVAELCQVSLDTVYKWTYEKGFPAVMGERQVRIHARLLDEWLIRRAEIGRQNQEEAVA